MRWPVINAIYSIDSTPSEIWGITASNCPNWKNATVALFPAALHEVIHVSEASVTVPAFLINSPGCTAISPNSAVDFEKIAVAEKLILN